VDQGLGGTVNRLADLSKHWTLVWLAGVPGSAGCLARSGGELGNGDGRVVGELTHNGAKCRVVGGRVARGWQLRQRP